MITNLFSFASCILACTLGEKELAKSVNINRDKVEIVVLSHSADRYIYVLPLQNHIVSKSFYSYGISPHVIA